MMPRGHSKSTILDVFNAWVIYCYPETQILHQGTTDSDAYKCSSGTRDVLARHPLTINNEDVKIKKGEVERWFVKGTDDALWHDVGKRHSFRGNRASCALHPK
jgi:hypothetical protein